MIGTGNSVVGLFVQGSHLGPILWLDFLVGSFWTSFCCLFSRTSSLCRVTKKAFAAAHCPHPVRRLEQALIAYGRLPLGLSNAATARYSTLTLIAPMVALIFLTLYADVSRVCMTLATLTGLVMLLFTIVSDRNELRIASGRLYLGNLRQKILLDAKIGEEERRFWSGNRFRTFNGAMQRSKSIGSAFITHNKRTAAQPLTPAGRRAWGRPEIPIRPNGDRPQPP